MMKKLICLLLLFFLHTVKAEAIHYSNEEYYVTLSTGIALASSGHNSEFEITPKLSFSMMPGLGYNISEYIRGEVKLIYAGLRYDTKTLEVKDTFTLTTIGINPMLYFYTNVYENFQIFGGLGGLIANYRISSPNNFITNSFRTALAFGIGGSYKIGPGNIDLQYKYFNNFKNNSIYYSIQNISLSVIFHSITVGYRLDI